MTEKPIPLAAQAPGQTHTRMNLETGAVWYSPRAVEDYIAEAIMRLRAEDETPERIEQRQKQFYDAVDEVRRGVTRELLTAIEDPQWVILDGMNALELAAYEHGGQAALAAVSKIIGSTASGDPARPELWPGVRARLIALTAKSKPLGALTAPEALRLAAEMSHRDIREVASRYERPSAIFRPALSIDGNMWCALYGANLQDGVAGFGKSPADAMWDFDRNWHEKLQEPKP